MDEKVESLQALHTSDELGFRYLHLRFFTAYKHAASRTTRNKLSDSDSHEMLAHVDLPILHVLLRILGIFNRVTIPQRRG
jgi:hypothetical protein